MTPTAFDGIKENPPDEFKTGPKHLTDALNWLIRQAKRGAKMLKPGRNIQIEKDGTIHADFTAFSLPFQVVSEESGGANGIRVGAGYLIDRVQSAKVTVNNLRTFLPLPAANAYIYLDVSTNDGNTTGATVKVSAAGWTGFPNIATFTSDPFAYNGNGAPPTQTNAYLTLAKFIDGDPAPLRQMATTHLQMRLVTYGGLPALYPFAGVGPNDP